MPFVAASVERDLAHMDEAERAAQYQKFAETFRHASGPGTEPHRPSMPSIASLKPKPPQVIEKTTLREVQQEVGWGRTIVRFVVNQAAGLIVGVVGTVVGGLILYYLIGS